MAVPTHRFGCTTTMWATLCPDCRDPVYFFSCSCGSRVFFDLPHHPWPPHKDRCIPYLMRYLRDVQQMSVAGVRQLLEEFALRKGLQVPQVIRRQLVVAENQETGRSTVIPILPRGEPVAAFGTVASVDSVNFVKRFATGGTVVGRALLGKLLNRAHVEVRIRGDRDPETGFIDEFSFYIASEVWRASQLRLGATVAVDLRVRSVRPGEPAWFADAVQSVRKRR